MISINLIPEDRQVASALRRRLKRWSAAAIVAVGLLSVPLVLRQLHRAEAGHLQVRFADARDRLSRMRVQVQAAKTDADEARMRLERAAALRAKRNWSGMVALIAASIPDACWLTALQTDPAVPGPAAPSPRTTSAKSAVLPARPKEMPPTVLIEAPRALKLTGYATMASQPHLFVANLKNSAVFARVELERSIREPVLDGSYYRFELRCEW